ncbi:hypothetical protein QFC22_001182 [Naganishia vaughanmartiniae]|uniref:Uncharacterized protein n=1 Tax=Naganishia vaughanmartiniae TaxID=1424756 RepID=A0ACC2XNV7_9TREE|nr:hypothetical protein QFC22_001182 [Naganishia vaughanmartiniae]
MAETTTRMKTRSSSKVTRHDDSADQTTTSSSSPLTLSELHDLLFELYNPAKWDDLSGFLASSDARLLENQAGVKALHEERYQEAVDSFSRLGRYDDALSDTNIASQILPPTGDPNVHFLAADIQLSQGKYENASKACEKAFQIRLRSSTKVKSAVAEQWIVSTLQQLIDNVPEYNGTRFDPFDSLPLDIIELVMQYGLDSDEYFVLKCTWVSRSWRQSLQSIPAVWRVYTYDPRARSTALERRKAWVRNAGGRLNEIRLVNVITKTAAKTINTTWKSLRILKLEGFTVDNAYLIQQLRQVYVPIYNIEALHVQCSYYRPGPHDVKLDLNLITPANRTTIQDLHVSRLRVDDYEASAEDDNDEAGYIALRSLSVKGCVFRWAEPARERRIVEETVQLDPVHQALRRAPNLKNLAIESSPHDAPHGYPRTYVRQMTVLPHLHTLRIPPPSYWSIDAMTPLVRHLAFTFVDGTTLRRGNALTDPNHWARNGLVPDLAAFAATGIVLDKLVSVELQINGGDTREDLLIWLTRMENVEKLTIVSAELPRQAPYQVSYYYYSALDSRLEEWPMGPNPANTANRSLIKLLNEDTSLCPKLEELCLSNMYTPEAPLLEWITARKAGGMAVSPISTLSLKHCTYISDSVAQTLLREVPAYLNVEYEDVSRLGWKELCDEWDQAVTANQYGTVPA